MEKPRKHGWKTYGIKTTKLCKTSLKRSVTLQDTLHEVKNAKRTLRRTPRRGEEFLVVFECVFVALFFLKVF